jgi:tRNA1Val (adenine37-N6)-methyltransferase
MSNSFFHFKQFTIHQDRCAMKVGTDGVLLGAWVNTGDAVNILDIGTGSGLIALMLAQRSEAIIDALEIDESATEQAAENVCSSPWKHRIRIIQSSLQEYNSNSKKYDLIVSNPPYFTNSLETPEPKRSMARHDRQLTLSDLIKCTKNLLLPKGRLGIILPTGAFDRFLSIAADECLFPARMMLVKASPEKPVSRVMAEFSYGKKEFQTAELIIEKNGRHNYSGEYTELTKEYYLNR